MKVPRAGAALPVLTAHLSTIRPTARQTSSLLWHRRTGIDPYVPDSTVPLQTWRQFQRTQAGRRPGKEAILAGRTWMGRTHPEFRKGRGGRAFPVPTAGGQHKRRCQCKAVEQEGGGLAMPATAGSRFEQRENKKGPLLQWRSPNPADSGRAWARQGDACKEPWTTHSCCL